MPEIPLRRKVWRDPWYFIALGFGSGLIPFAPGTWGTVVAIPLYLLCAQCSWGVYFTIMLLAFFLGIVVCDRVARDLGKSDPSVVVWDEIVGYGWTMFLVPPKWSYWVAGFVLFRIFDVWKPQPIRWVDQKVQGGLGIMLDDFLAAIPAWLILQVFLR